MAQTYIVIDMQTCRQATEQTFDDSESAAKHSKALNNRGYSTMVKAQIQTTDEQPISTLSALDIWLSE